MDLDKLFYPDSIAVVGATEHRHKWGAWILTSVIDGGFEGEVYPVTHNKKTVFGRRAYSSLEEIEGAIDLVFITTPIGTVLDILEQCVRKQVTNVVLITAGYSETGKEGAELEREVVQYCRSKGINLIGPNTMGIINTAHGLYATGTHVLPPRGAVSIIAQSGNVGNQIMEWAEQQGIGIGKFIGSGNEGLMGCEDYLEYLCDDEDTSVVVMYLEGLKDGRKLLDAARKTTAKKPVIILKAGRTESGSRAAQSHTGALASPFNVIKGAFRQSGVTLTMNSINLIYISSAFDSLPMPLGRRVGIITLGGGWGVIMADECEEKGLEIPPLPAEVTNTLDRLLPPFWSRGNPVDLVGKIDINMYIEATRAMAECESFDAIFLLGLLGSTTLHLRVQESAERMGFCSKVEVQQLADTFTRGQTEFLDIMIDLMEEHHKPIYPVTMIPSRDGKMLYSRPGKKYKVVIHVTPERAAFCLSKQCEYMDYLRRRNMSHD